jgi:glycosyltransferase involved in cell wall biosynthesis
MPHLCHLTLLNPALHSRIFYKEAVTQRKAGWQVTVIGQGGPGTPAESEGVRIIATGAFHRMGWQRFTLRRKILREALALRADVYQVHTPELLGVAIKLRRKLPGCRVVYDMHEDYAANILHAGYYSPTTQRILSTSVRRAEMDFGKKGDGVIYAEECYGNLLNVEQGRHITIRNKYNPPAHPASPQLPDFRYLLHTGTLAGNWGVHKAFDVWLALRRHFDIGLVFAGHGHDLGLVAALRARAKREGLEHRFRIYGGNEYLPYPSIPPLIENCLAGLALYEVTQNIEHRIPTKFYEFMAHRKPLLFTAYPEWEEMNDRYDFGKAITLPLEGEPFTQLILALHDPASHFYRKELPREAWSWDTEAKALIPFLQQLTRR